ncbi:hypothetical protein FQA47_017219 [Oryzias melastigma]|uniref:Secreted protein n=1 Tax=Oryzias melastigma TaxID=30732 RepID=A0A834BWS8_ORYME|nr:hypothetical protein FQA47_017219 [Oryzias melastigma]
MITRLSTRLVWLVLAFDAIGSGPCREFSVRATALLNMASDGMILTNHDHQIRVGVLTGKRFLHAFGAWISRMMRAGVLSGS